MTYLAYVNENKEEQLLKDHLKQTAELCGKLAEAFGAYEYGYFCGLLHDIGKYSEEFQRRIRGSAEKVDHATAGVKLCWEKGGLYQLLGHCIAGHLSMFIRMLYSCLADADYLDTEVFMNSGEAARNIGESMDILYGRFESYVSEWLKNKAEDTINGRRTEILQNCLEKGSEEKGLFRMTVPTGGGKTVASLGFALKHAREHQMDRIIYVIPYTSIIEQNAKVFSDILGVENVLENHCQVDYESSEELKPMQLASENWDKPVIVTTNVQFFESMFSNKSSKCRKLHNIANSVIIFDEAQMLPNMYLKPCMAVIEQLLRYYCSTIVLCTVTQPALKGILAEDIKARELCPRMEE